MPYTPPSTVTGSDVLTAALWNTQIRDNLNELRFNPYFVRAVLTSSINPYTGSAAIPWSSATHNVGGMWSAGSPTAITIQATGLYLVNFICAFSTGTGANTCTLQIRKSTGGGAATTVAAQLAPRIISGTSPGLVVNGVSAQVRCAEVLRLVQTDVLTFHLGAQSVNGSGSITPVSVDGSASENLQTAATVNWLGALA